jgi:hypothetical protein
MELLQRVLSESKEMKYNEVKIEEMFQEMRNSVEAALEEIRTEA